MQTWEEGLAATMVVPKTIRFCKACQKETSHELRMGAGGLVRLCVPCLEDALRYELDRE